MQAEGSAYQPLLDTEVDLDFDGVRDPGVSTGKGRAGDGMRYFRIDSKKARLTDVGEAPRLERSTAGVLDVRRRPSADSTATWCVVQHPGLFLRRQRRVADGLAQRGRGRVGSPGER